MSARRAAWLLAVVGLVGLPGCGGGQADELKQASDNLAAVRSGSMDLRMSVGAGDASSQVGFEESGPFSLPSSGALPVARTQVVHFVGDKKDGNTFISTGRSAYVESGGQTYQLPPASIARLKQASTANGSLAALQLARWAAPGTRVSDGGQVDGVATDHIAGAVQVKEFINDVMQLSRGLGQAAAVPQLTAADGTALARATRSSSFELWVGRDDHLPRRLAIRVDFGAPSSAANSEALSKYSQSRINLDLSLTGVNRPVTVADPAGAQPFSAFCARQADAAACSSAAS